MAHQERLERGTVAPRCDRGIDHVEALVGQRAGDGREEPRSVAHRDVDRPRVGAGGRRIDPDLAPARQRLEQLCMADHDLGGLGEQVALGRVQHTVRDEHSPTGEPECVLTALLHEIAGRGPGEVLVGERRHHDLEQGVEPFPLPHLEAALGDTQHIQRPRVLHRPEMGRDLQHPLLVETVEARRTGTQHRGAAHEQSERLLGRRVEAQTVSEAPSHVDCAPVVTDRVEHEGGEHQALGMCQLRVDNRRTSVIGERFGQPVHRRERQDVGGVEHERIRSPT